MLGAAGVLVLALVSACATWDGSHPRRESHAFGDPSSTRLGRVFTPGPDVDPGDSGVEMIRYGRNALEVRLFLADAAERSLDLQYYIWDADVSGGLLGERLFDAAERGVRVRLLLDDISIVGRDDALARMSGHPHIEIRAFNPFRHRSRRWRELFTDPSRVNRRSHNKVMIADNAVAIVGGRNIADHYFGVHGASNYRDLDAFVVGPVVRDSSHVFDAFWNSEHAVPYEAFVDEPPTPEDARERGAAIRARVAAAPLPYPIEEDVGRIVASLEEIRNRLVWAPIRVLYDDPSKVEDRSVQGIAPELAAVASGAKEEILIENAYFVPREPLVELADAAARRGVRFRVLTNSLASNDVSAVHAGYKKYRKALLESGAEIYELRPDASVKERWSILSTRSRAGLHTKTMVIDRRYAVIGSYNLDPRSADINTELVLFVDSPVFGAEVAAFLDEGVASESAYRVTLENGELRWTTEQEGREVVYSREPETSWWKRFSVSLIGILPIHSQL